MSETFYPARPAGLPPLSFGRVNDGRPITSKTLLFRLPIELVHEVVAYLDTADLQSLALVDRDCRQLARSRLFTSVVVGYIGGPRALLDNLSHHGAQSRRENGGVTEGPSIGACIRRVTVAKCPRESSCRRMSSPTDVSPCKKEKCSNHDSGLYLQDIAEALRFSLPNLDDFVWEDRVKFPQHILMAIASSPIRHLGLRVLLSPDCEYQLPPPEQQRWALRSLDLGGVLYPRAERRDRDVSKFCFTILKAAAPTLERLSWRDYQGIKLSFGTSAIRFPKLRTILLDTNSIPDDTVLELFFPPDVENCVVLSVSIKIPSPQTLESLAQRGHIRRLESLCLDSINLPRAVRSTDAVFLSANPQLKSLTLRMHTPEQLASTLLPLPAPEFEFLTTLAVAFTLYEKEEFSRLLAAISRLTTLTSLWIAAGIRHDWTADVPTTTAVLSPLRNLTRLALARSYTAVAFHTGRPRSRTKRRVQDAVQLYAKAFRELRWVYCGELVYRVTRDMVMLDEEGLPGYSYFSPERLWKNPDWPE